MTRVMTALSLLLLLSSPTFASCVGDCPYFLDSNASGLGRVASDSFDSVSGQSAKYNIAATGAKLYGATSPSGRTAIGNAISTGNPQGDVSLPSSGIVAFEFAVDQFPASGPSNSGTTLTLSSGVTTGNWDGVNTPTGDFMEYGLALKLTPSGASVLLLGITFNSGTQAIAIKSSSASLPLAANYRVGFYINMGTRRFGYTVNGVDQGYVKDLSNNYMTVPSAVSALSLFAGGSTSGVQSTDTLLGQAIGGRLITAAADMTQPFPSGAKDICGNTI